jgi:hypothetical protein
MERILGRDEKAYKNMIAVAKILTAVSINDYEYKVEDVYFDFGQDWMWTTITHDSKWGGVQILNPRQWEKIVMAFTVEELFSAVEDIRSGKYFDD